MASKRKGLLERLGDNEFVIAAEGYAFYFERAGYHKSGLGVPEVVLDHPEVVEHAYREFVHAGSDVIVSYTYYGHREKLRLAGREGDIEKLNKTALNLARKVADETNTLVAGDLSNTNIYHPDHPERNDNIKAMMKEQTEWAVECGADMIVAETFTYFGEAMLALEVIKSYGKGLPSVITLAPFIVPTMDGHAITADKLLVSEACKKLQEAGADVVGLNCGRGPKTMLPLLKEIKEVCPGPLAALPVPFRTTSKEPTFFMLTDPLTGKKVFPGDVDIHSCTREDINEFGEECKRLGIQYIGLCCGNRAYYTRALAESLARTPPASQYSLDMSKHYVYGTDAKVKRDVADDSLKLYHTLGEIDHI
ncbi:betaine--homocysteine S-methyltransferase 1-like [Saccoglossus kowalevskii]|uniref:Betaine--homocysteine S-methyltransferase 1-like n=1 Tax=Saccoglossus kowalevskii TaxID=10224 RepID=A0ABM0GYQ5_SACKO|nr:PREDICTED: betaine--homocysteine S-methyltransferase 1-like [Saccoglossus kowalevskii]